MSTSPVIHGTADSSNNAARSTDTDEDHVWRFALASPACPADQEDPLLEMVRCFLRDLLSMGFLTRSGERVRVDGFAFNNAPGEIHPIFRDGAAAAESAAESPETQTGRQTQAPSCSTATLNPLMEMTRYD